MGQGSRRRGGEKRMLTVVLPILVKVAAVGFGLGIIIMFHELGHFLAAKMVGLEVERFSIGFPPHIWKRKAGDTEYCIGAIPLGGYVKVDLGTSGENVSPVAWYKRSMVVLAGPLANLFLAALMIFLVLGVVGREIPVHSNVIGSSHNQLGLAIGDTLLAINGVTVNNFDEAMENFMLSSSGDLLAGTTGGRRSLVYELSDEIAEVYIPFISPVIGEAAVGMPAYEAGLREGDSLISIDGQRVVVFADVQSAVSAYPGFGELEIVFARGEGGELHTARVNPLEFEDLIRIGIVAEGESVTMRFPLGRALVVGCVASVEGAAAFYDGLIKLIARPRDLVEMSGGPVYVVETLGQQAGFGLARLLETISYISLAIMGFNLLPIPVLDGGQFLFLLYEGLRRKPLSKKGVQFAQHAGLVVILVLFSVIIFKDIHRVLTRVN